VTEPRRTLGALALHALGIRVPAAARDAAITSVTLDSRRVTAGSVFVAIAGQRLNGEDFAAAAVSAGAVAVVAARELDLRVPTLVVRDTRLALARLACAFEGDPSRDLVVVGVTGTNGKTSVVNVLAQILRAAGHRTATLGTLGLGTEDGYVKGDFTTPEAPELQRRLAELLRGGYTHVVMEVSSHAVAMLRVEGTHFTIGAWTNLSQDHLDFHGTMEAYAAAKTRFVTELLDAPFRPGRAVLNACDPVVAKVALGCKGAWSFSSKPGIEARVQARTCDTGRRGIAIDLASPAGELRVRSRLVGAHNAENLTCVATIALALGLDAKLVERALSDADAPRGRMEPVEAPLDAFVAVDYAHTPDALEKALETTRTLAEPGGRTLVVFGCGGDRDASKRAPMGRVASRLAELAIATSDNPRSESPFAILAQIEVGLREHAQRVEALVPSELARTAGAHVYLVEQDRDQAIRRAIFALRPGDSLLIAGKGHELEQRIGAEVRAFDDAAVARRWLAARRESKPTQEAAR